MERLQAEIPKVGTVAREDAFEVFRNRICNILVGFGLQELNTFNITSKDALNTKMNVELECVELANALTVDYGVLRSWVLPSLMQVVGENTHHEYPQNVFTTGTVFRKDAKSETGVREDVRLAVGLCKGNANFTDVKQIVDEVGHALNVQFNIREAAHGSFIEGRVGRVSVQGKDVAYVGEMHPAVLEAWKVEMPVAAFELNLSELFAVLKVKN